MPTAHLQITLPHYAQDMLWLTGKSFQMQIPNVASVDLSKFTDQLPLVLRWGTAEGSPLQRWHTMSSQMTWDGELRIGGFVEATHILMHQHMELMVIEVQGNPLDTDFIRLPSMQDLRNAPFERSLFVEADAIHWYSFLLPLDSPLSDFAHHALVNGQAADFYGRFADGFQNVVGMPILLESMTLYGGSRAPAL
jgi:hypothetical protein